MKRRDLFASIALAAGGAGGQSSASESIYIPKAQWVEDRALLHDFMDEFAFVELVTAAPSPRITHIPVLLDRKAGPYGTLYGHVARNNPQSQVFDGPQTAVVVFRGPHSYISPTWYLKAEAVPTWDFAVVHATGKPRPIADKKAVHDLLARLIQKFEDRYGKSSYDFSKLPDSYTYGMIGGIVGFEMPVESLEGKFKLGQDRSEAEKAELLKHLETAKRERTLSEFTASFYERLAKAGGAQGPA
jgi:transcriptional regulator